MKTLATIAVLFVAALHFGFLALEMFFWDHEIGRKVFSMTPEESALTKILAANQGLYNGILAVGLLWGVIAKKRDVISFFLLSVMVAGAFGAVTAKPTILFTQAMPAAVAFLLVMLSRPKGMIDNA